MTKIDVISGFLGAGKTTFIKKLLEEAVADEKVVLIENEFGEIGIDGGFLKDAGIEIREMNSGCICCSLVGDFGKSLVEVISRYQPERVIIEPSGVGKLSDVMKAVRDVSADLDVLLNSSVTVVDVKKCKMYMKNFGEFFNDQIEYAGNIVLSRTDIADREKTEAAVAMIREHNPSASIITTPLAQLTGAQLLEIIEKPDTMMADLLAQVKEAYHEHEHDHEHHHEHHHEDGCGCHEHEHDHGDGGHGHHHDDECGVHGHDGHRHGYGDGEHEHHHDDVCGVHGHVEHHHDHGHAHDDHEHEHGEHHHSHDGHDHEHGHHHDHGDGCDCGCHDHEHHHHHADEIFTSWGLETTVPCTRKKLEEILERLAESTAFGEVLRAKGMLPTEKEGVWLYFDLVPEQVEIREGQPDHIGKICVIGARLKEEELKKAFGRS
ncbi:MAG: GTP-binding protein [Lachnospiraceae bacterium]|nr:GTP-binding protein [Lachnospiraceae bacterium]